MKKNVKDTKEELKVEKKPMTKEEAAAYANELATEGVGKCVMAWATKGKTNLVLKDLKKDSSDSLLKLFCVSWDEVTMDGLVLAKIESFRVDKKNNVYIVVKPLLSLKDVKYLFSSAVWEFFLDYGVMWKPYGGKRDVEHERFNVEEAYKKLGYEKGEDEAATRCAMWNDMLAGKFTFEALSKALNTATTYEIQASKLYKLWKGKNLDKYRKHALNFLYPMLSDRLNRENFNEKQLAEFLKKEDEAYSRLGLDGAKNVFEKAEAVMQHYATLKKEQKEAAKAAKKAAKS